MYLDNPDRAIQPRTARPILNERVAAEMPYRRGDNELWDQSLRCASRGVKGRLPDIYSSCVLSEIANQIVYETDVEL